MTDDFDTWLTALERQVERIPTLHGDHAGVKTELRRLVAYARGRTVAYARGRVGPPPPATAPVTDPAPAQAPDPAPEPEPPHEGGE